MQIPTEWTFNTPHIADNFDKHIYEQLPWYGIVTSAVRNIARHYVSPHGLIYDIGASTGNIGRALASLINERQATFVALDSADAMLSAYTGPSRLLIADAFEYPYEEFDLAVCFLTIMFMPPRQQAAFIQRLRAKLRHGGALIIVDKCKSYGGYAATVMWRMALDAKLANGADPKEILEKELSLAGIQRPIDKAILGDDALEFFRFGDFAGWVIEG